ncbi:cyanophycinase [Sphingobacterium thalpophilum]|uniref:cyanophycinase n=1 Tax=Sphingobacterium thalpophilum TaxID=259 RepID=UPI0024A62978|nr:cyanophycinase [Sphingobacterium thalpophilum]
MVPKGKLLIIGGAEERKGQHPSEELQVNERFDILKKLLPKGHEDGRVELITSASSAAEEVADMYRQTFKQLGYGNFGFMNPVSKDEAQEQGLCDRIQKADTVFLTGGDQLRLSTILAGTALWDLVKQRYERDKGFMIAGTSAGAMALSEIMIIGGGMSEALIGADIQTASGLSFLHNCIIDTHFIKRGRFSRLAHAILLNTANLGIGLGEDAALLITQGRLATCVGSGMVVVIDGEKISNTNISDAQSGSPVYVADLKVHLLVEGCKLNLADKELFFPKIT